jgi:hypothetical protein
LGFEKGFRISASSLKKIIPTAINAWQEAQARDVTASGNGDKDTEEYDTVMENLLESIEQQRHKNDVYKKASAASKKMQDDLDNFSTDQRNQGVQGMNEANRAAGPRAAATTRAASTRDGLLAEQWDDDEAGSEELDAAQIYANTGVDRRPAAGAGAESSVDRLVNVLAEGAAAAKEDKVEQRALDTRRIDNDSKRIEIEAAAEVRRSAEHEAKVQRDLLRDRAKIASDIAAADRAAEAANRAAEAAKATQDMIMTIVGLMKKP